MKEEFHTPTPDNDNKTERERIAEEKELIAVFNNISKFRETVEASDLLVTQKGEFLEKIDKIRDALFNKESAPRDALSRMRELSLDYGLPFEG